MQLFTPVILLSAALFSSTFALPTNSDVNTSVVRKREWPAQGAIEFCKEEGFKSCWRLAPPSYNTCYSLTNGYAAEISSYRVDYDCCKFWDNDSCDKNPIFQAQNRENAKIEGKINNAIRSFRCHYECRYVYENTVKQVAAPGVPLKDPLGEDIPEKVVRIPIFQ
ncbi:hypothetical protein FPQ18DRAFT_374945 [Pyronema domesticum]|uniref:Uncharacterized protein n=1 Tax=Pyronema omphalodes (strain CBS 100304) TaxID=1076935 RepID=U4L7L4_PYROM|nr:hypothetical protein FPQ18DRAFT_374945 [Pyronema domesticum]CCX08904.1 Protein of unknown function [Pyronema omphalodes CBS 100304]